MINQNRISEPDLHETLTSINIMPKLKIQKLQTQDEAAECARIMSTSEPWITLERTYEKCLMILNDKTREVHVAYKDEELIGFIILIMQGALDRLYSNSGG